MLHQKELVLNENQTKDMLDTFKLMDRVRGLLPKVSTSNIVSSLKGQNIAIENHYRLEVNIENMSGNKKDVDVVVDEIMKGLRKMKG